MQFEKISDNITLVKSEEDTFELHKSLLFATTSRSLKSVEERKEFYEQKKGLTEKSNSFMSENLGFGDRSIAEMYNFNLEFYKVPLTFSLQCLAFEYISPQESSTRYLRMPEDFFHKFEHMSHLPGYDNYLNFCSSSLKLYNKAFEDVFKFYRAKFPAENIEWGKMSNDEINTAYNSTIKSKTADAVKVFLPMSTYTNFNCVINARALQDLIGELVFFNNLNDGLIKPFLDPLINYVKTNENTKALFSKLDDTISIWSQKTMHHDKFPKMQVEAPVHHVTPHVVSYNMCPYYNIPVNTVPRVNRHDRLNTVYKYSQFVFTITSSLGVYRDMNRHRAVHKGLLSLHVPLMLIINEDMTKNFSEYVQEFTGNFLLRDIASVPLYHASLPLGVAIDWSMVCSLYELSNIVELRTGKGGYWEYIRLARELAQHIGMRYNIFEHADMTTDYNETLPTLKQEMKKVVVK